MIEWVSKAKPIQPPAASSIITAGFEFDIPVRFDTDHIQAVLEAFGAGRIAPLGIVELFEEVA